MPSSLDDWLSLIQARHTTRIELGLDRCAAVWARMGAPVPARKVITVAGTNGKGSTVAAADAMLRALGLRVGAYTSPHLLRYNERIRVDGKDLSDSDIVSGFERVEPCVKGESLTYFEFVTLAAMASLAALDLDYAILEVGLGGRLDAVNIVDPDCAVITPVGIDHEAYLGSDRESIGFEKAGILRKGGRLVCGDRDPPGTVVDAAGALGCTYLQIGRDYDVVPTGQDWQYRLGGVQAVFSPAMPGRHQADNVATALTVVLSMVPDAEARVGDICRVVPGIRVRGRLETISMSPEVIVDVGHNPLAAEAIHTYLEARGAGAVQLVLGMLCDKDCEGFAARLSDGVAAWYCGSLEGDRGQSGSELARRITPFAAGREVVAFDSIGDAIQGAITRMGPDGIVLVCGSFQTAGEAIAKIKSITHR